MVYQTEGNGVRPALILSVLSFLPSGEKQERRIKREKERERRKMQTLKYKWAKK